MAAVSEPPAATADAVTDGVFFTAPGALPRGRNALPREQVQAAQRERILIAATELLAASGTADLGPKEICLRAKVSLSSFYDMFVSRDACVFAAYDRFIEVLLGRLMTIEGDGLSWRDYMGAVLGTYLGALAVDPVVGRAFQVQMDAMGEPARARRRTALSAIAHLLHDKHVAWDPRVEGRFPFEAYLAGVYGIRQLAADLLEEGRVAELPEFSERAAAWTALLFGSDSDAGLDQE